jgi:arginyl-tRNA synthetase
MSPLAELKRRFREALAGAADGVDELVELVRRSQDPKFGDYQANLAMPLGKRLGRPPREVAAEIVSGLELDDLCTKPEIAGPGFINLRIRDAWLAAALRKAVGDERLGVPAVATPKTFVLD